MAKPYQEGRGWCVRKRYRGHDIYVSGKESKSAAEKELRQRMAAIDAGGKPQHLGPTRTTLAYALQEFGFEHLPHLKGAPQEVRRINKYLEAAGVQLLLVQRSAGSATTHYDVSLKPLDAQRVVPQGLGAHRKALLCKTASSDRIRQVLAQTLVADITRLDIQRLMDALARDGLAPATIALERALLRRFFNHVKTKWTWAQPADNPATALKLPKIDNGRDRVLSPDEQALLDIAFEEARNERLTYLYALLRETGMRASEPLVHATWSCVDWEHKILNLRDGKDGRRKVPLSPAALQALQALGPGEPEESLVNVSYEALKAGFRRACERAGIKDLHLHDLRHTAATRLARDSGNALLVKALTGHKTEAMVARYTHIKAEDVVEFFHKGSAADATASPAMFTEEQVQALVAQAVQDALSKAMANMQPPVFTQPSVQTNTHQFAGSNVVPFRRVAA